MQRFLPVANALFRLSLRGRLLLVLVLLGIIPLLGLIVYTATEQRRELAANGVQTALGVARLINKHQESIVEGVRGTLVALAQLPEARSDDGVGCSRLLLNVLQQYPLYANLGVAGRDGAIFCSALPSSGAVNVADRPWFRCALETRQLAIGEYQVGRISGKPALNFGYPVFGDGRPEPQGVIFASLDLVQLSRQLVAQAPLPEGAVFLAIDRDNTILARHPDPERWIGRLLADAPLLEAIQTVRAPRPAAQGARDCGQRPEEVVVVAPRPDEGTAEAASEDGIARLYAFSPLGGVPEAGVSSVIGVPRAAAVAAADRLLARNLAGLALVGVVVLAAVWAGGGLFIARPVNTLLRVTRRLAAGDYQARAGLSDDRGELGHLARAIDQMAEALEQRRAEHERMEADRRRIEQRLLRAQRLEAAGRIAGQVAHDFNNLLSPLTAFPEVIKARLPAADQEARALCDTMFKAAQQMADINEDLRALGRRGLLHPEPLDLNLVIQEALTQMPPPPSTLDVDLQLAADLLPVSGSEAQLVRVLVNLLGNAREAMRETGRLVIRTENVYLDQPVGRYTRVEAGEYVRVEVGDTGPGIAPQHRDQVFEPFWTTKRTDRQRGSGLGLSIVQAVVGDHGGYVDLQTEVGQGATFSVYLPVSRAPVSPRRAAEVRGGAERILVVDDDPLQRETIGHLLRPLGYQVESADSGEAAVARAERSGPDLVILDMKMRPGIDGCETYRRLRELRPGQRAIIVSGSAETARVQEALALGADAFVRKPLTLENLAPAVREALDRPR